MAEVPVTKKQPKADGTCLVFIQPNVAARVLERLNALALEWPGDQRVVVVVATGKGVRHVRLPVRVHPSEDFQAAVANILAAAVRR